MVNTKHSRFPTSTGKDTLNLYEHEGDMLGLPRYENEINFPIGVMWLCSMPPCVCNRNATQMPQWEMSSAEVLPIIDSKSGW